MTRRQSRLKGTYKVGEFAALAGVSVRTLHHYEGIGLLMPSARTDSGHRLYGPADIERLTRITTLRSLGFSLEQVRAALDDGGASTADLVALHLTRSRELLAEQRTLCTRLEQIVERLRTDRDDVDTLIETMEVVTMIERYYTPEQLDQLARRREELGEDAIRQVEREWQDLFASLRAAMDAGKPPDAPDVQTLARRARELISQFTGGDPGIQASLDKMYAEQPVEMIHPSFDPAIFKYMNEAMAALDR